MKTKIVILIIGTVFLFLQQQTLTSQSKINFLEGNLAFSKPTGFFSRNIPQVKIGFEAGYLRQLKAEKPLFWGISVYYHPLNTASATIEEFLDFNLVNFDYTTTSNLLGFNGKMRFYPDIYLGKTELYLEALFGYKWLFTSTSKTLSDDQDSSDSSFESGSLSLTYGAAAGVNYPVYNQLFINLRVNYLPGLSTSYFVRNNSSTVTYSSIELFDLKKSTTDIVRWDIGVTWRFTGQNEE